MGINTLGYWLAVLGGTAGVAVILLIVFTRAEDSWIFRVGVALWVLMFVALAFGFTTGMFKGVARVGPAGPGWLLPPRIILGMVVSFVGGHAIVFAAAALLSVDAPKPRPSRPLSDEEVEIAEYYGAKWRAVRKQQRLSRKATER